MNNYATETMTCVCRYMSTGLKIKAKDFQYAVYRDGLSDSLYVTVNWHPDTSTSYVLENILKCTCNGTTYRFARTAGWADPVCVIPYIPKSQSPSYTLAPISSSDALYYSNGNRTSYSFSPGNYTTLPKLVVNSNYIIANNTQRMSWTLTPGDSRRGWVTSLEVRYRDIGTESWNTIVDFADTQRNYRDLTTDDTIAGKEVYMAYEYRTYLSNWGGTLEDFETLNWFFTPVGVDGFPGEFPQLGNIVLSDVVRPGTSSHTVSWDPASESSLWTTDSYKLERAYSGFADEPTTYTEIYNGTNLQYVDTLPLEAKRIRYRLCVTATTITENISKAGDYIYSKIYEAPYPGVYIRIDNKWLMAGVT